MTTAANISVILTHPADSNEYLHNQLSQSGINVVLDPMIETSPISLTHKQVKDICNAEVVIFTSKRGVEYATSQINPACCCDKQIVVVGQKTAESLEKCHIKPVWISTGQISKQMCDEIIEKGLIQDKKVVAILAQLADDTIEKQLSHLCQFQRINIYQTKPTTRENLMTKQLIESHQKVAVVFTSASAVHAFAKIYSQFKGSHVSCISIGPTTSAAIIEKGQNVKIEANPSTYERLFEVLTEYIQSQVMTQKN